MVRQGAERPLNKFPRPWLGRARQCKARLGLAVPGTARGRRANEQVTHGWRGDAGRCKAMQGMARLGGARLGDAGLGKGPKGQKESMTDQYPIDFSAVEKGQVFRTEDLEQITRTKYGTPAWVWELRRLQDEIQKRRLFTVKNDGKELHVLTDTEAAVHNAKLFRQNLRGLASRHRLDLAVDPSNLTTHDQERHAHNLVNQSRYLSALTEVTKCLRVEGRAHHPKRLPEPDKEESKV